MGVFIGLDGRLLLHGEPDVVQSLQQAALAEGIHTELAGEAVAASEHLVLEVYLDEISLFELTPA